MALGLEMGRVAPHLDLAGKRILDVGCGNGYYMWRMLGAGADSVVGVDPNWLFFCQFHAMKRYLPELPAWHLPFALEELPPKLEGFETVFSMGVLYHRRSPVDHLLDLKDCLVRGGELVLETLVVEGDENTALVPEDRYAQMRNVWFLPSVPALERWLRRAGFVDVRCVDVSVTSVENSAAPTGCATSRYRISSTLRTTAAPSKGCRPHARRTAGTQALSISA